LPASSAPGGSCADPNRSLGEWRSYGHDYNNTRNQQNEKKIGPAEAVSLRPSWVFSTDGKGDFTGTPAVADGCVYAGSNDGWVYALNADNGKVVWKTKIKRGGINSSAAVFDGKVFVHVSRVGKPAAVALDQDSGRILWDSTVETQPGADIYSSPVYYDDLVFSGWSGGSAELGDESDRVRFQGGFVLLDADTGALVKKTYTIRPPDKNPNKPKDLYAGGAIWSTPAIDTGTGYAYAGTGNPFRPQKEHKYTNAILKIDLNRNNRTFGEIVDHYHGTIDEYAEPYRQLPCYDLPDNPPPYYPQGIGACGDLDMDFGAAPNLFSIEGVKFIGEGQKSGVYHVARADNMKPVYESTVGPPSAVGGIVGSTAFDGEAIYGPITIGGYLWSIAKADGIPRWFMPLGDGAHWGNPVSLANGVVYTVDLKGFLSGFDASTGAQVFAYPLWFAGGDGAKATWGGVSIARHTVYAAVGITGLSNGYIVAFKPSG
jgi:polyvinyl alcohol dehydrogenase (cytochrome)